MDKHSQAGWPPTAGTCTSPPAATAGCEPLADQLTSQHGVHVQIHAADLTDPGDLLRLEQTIATAGPDLLVNNAGFAAYSGPIPPQPLPYRATYAAAKAFQVTFTQALAAELAGTGVQVQACCPGLIDTEFHALAGRDLAATVVSNTGDDTAPSRPVMPRALR